MKLNIARRASSVLEALAKGQYQPKVVVYHSSITEKRRSHDFFLRRRRSTTILPSTWFGATQNALIDGACAYG